MNKNLCTLTGRERNVLKKSTKVESSNSFSKSPWLMSGVENGKENFVEFFY